jgi:hypothetical protein
VLPHYFFFGFFGRGGTSTIIFGLTSTPLLGFCGELCFFGFWFSDFVDIAPPYE